MISFEQALEKILSYVDILEEVESPILDCLGQVRIARDSFELFVRPAILKMMGKGKT